MAQSSFSTSQYTSADFVESCGAILFDLSAKANKKVCLVNHLNSNQWLLAKGRRNINETRKDAAIREVIEETGYRCHLLPLRLPTRACSADEPSDIPDEARVRTGVTELFMCTVRQLSVGKGVKIISWFVATLDEGAHEGKGVGEEKFKAEFFACSEAVEKLYFETDREVLRTAIELVVITIG
ncbi:NUDIX domain-containing protein [Setomelanomma holmii]|uniref:NUDIX domain-containing protein n=1 Tax=Setomelanomma holmii TaxID=210430 RepID=A0A9P4HE47_9PLEO|nr:NUDIX domain-containing protein [Setomelanomma holmii]